ncbi:hypothetical protein cypCar_00008197 [Cyprinus carpio]|nr:hypothetical protein cypCar_00008197 [Cyprinus carpio]
MKVQRFWTSGLTLQGRSSWMKSKLFMGHNRGRWVCLVSFAWESGKTL